MTTPVPIKTITSAQQRILAVLTKQPNLTVADIAAQAFVGVSTLACGGYIRALKEARLIHISGWRKVKGRFSTPLYSCGDKDDIARPRIDDTNREAPGMERIVEALIRCGGVTYREIAEITGLSLHTVKNSGYLDALIAQGRIHIGQWRRSRNGPMAPVYVAGSGDNAAKPLALSAGEKMSRHRMRRSRFGEGGTLSAQLVALCRVIDASGTVVADASVKREMQGNPPGFHARMSKVACFPSFNTTACLKAAGCSESLK